MFSNVQRKLQIRCLRESKSCQGKGGLWRWVINRFLGHVMWSRHSGHCGHRFGGDIGQICTGNLVLRSFPAYRLNHICHNAELNSVCILSSCYRKSHQLWGARHLVWTGCGPGRFGNSSVFSLQVFDTNTAHKIHKMESPLQQLEKIRWDQVS